MKRLYSMLGLAAGLVLSLAFPQRIYAAQTDTITLENQGEQVAVSVNMANANKEKITAISMSLNVEVQGGNKDDVSFLFSQALEEAVKDYRYDKDRGVLSIYVASGSSLFDENDNLNLGAVRFQKADSADSLKAEVSVAENSIQTVNKAYGSRDTGYRLRGAGTCYSRWGGQKKNPEAVKASRITARSRIPAVRITAIRIPVTI